MIKQVEELENEKRQLVARLKAQEKKVDHLERAKRKEEIPVIKEAMKKDEEEDKIIWKNKEEERIKVAIADREEAVKTRDRLARMKEDKNAFMEKLLKERREDFENLLSDFKKSVDTTRQKVKKISKNPLKRKEFCSSKLFCKQTFMSFFGFCQTFNIQILKQRKNIRQIEGSLVLFCYNVNLLPRVFEKKFAKMKGFR